MDVLRYLDLFAGAGGLSEGFIRAGYKPVAHVEMDQAACYTLKTRLAYKWLTENENERVYLDYIKGVIDRDTFYQNVPDVLLDTVINYEISWDNLEEIFSKMDATLQNHKIDLILGGPPCHLGRLRWKK